MYNKLFASMLDSTIWLEPLATRIVWITLIAVMDEDGFAHFSAIQNLAIRAGVTLEEARSAIDCFSSPDPESGDPANQGRRIERVPGGFIILNALKYREAYNRERQKDLNRKRVAEFRSKRRNTSESLHSITGHYSNANEYESSSEGTKIDCEKPNINKSGDTYIEKSSVNKSSIAASQRRGANISSATLTPKNALSAPTAQETGLATKPEDASPVVLRLPCVGGAFFSVHQSWVDKVQSVYVGVDVMRECQKALLWLEAEPSKQKTVKGCLRFLTGWMARAQNSGSVRHQQQPGAGPDYSKAKTILLIQPGAPRLKYGDCGPVLHDLDGPNEPEPD